MIKIITNICCALALLIGAYGCIEGAPEHPTKKLSSTGQLPVDEDTGKSTTEPDAVSNFVNPVHLGIPDAGEEEEEEEKEEPKEEPEDTGQPEDTGLEATDDGCNVFNPNYPDC